MTIQCGLTGPPITPDYRLRVWSDRPAGPVTVRTAASGLPIVSASVIPLALPPSLAGDARLPRTLVEISGLPSDTLLEVEMGGERCRALTLPPPDGELRLLLGSCFYLTDDRGRLAAGWDNLHRQDLPHLRVQCGDQLYLDAGALPDGPTPFDRTLRRYRRYWDDPAQSRFLRGGVSLFVPDDHDYWNDYPYFMPHLSRTWGGEWEAHAAAADRTFQAFQALGNPGGRSWGVLDLGPVSLFFMDTRTHRGTADRHPPARVFDPDQRDALLAWSAGLGKPGVLISAMPLFQKPTGKFLFYTSDHNLLAWPADARQIWRAVERSPWPVVVLAGDIHRGVVTEWRTGGPAAVRQHYEVVASPLCLLGYPYKPGRKAAVQPGGLQLGEAMGRRDPTKTFYGTSLDHFVLVRFRAQGPSVHLSVSAHRFPLADIPSSELEPAGGCAVELDLRRHPQEQP